MSKKPKRNHDLNKRHEQYRRWAKIMGLEQPIILGTGVEISVLDQFKAIVKEENRNQDFCRGLEAHLGSDGIQRLARSYFVPEQQPVPTPHSSDGIQPSTPAVATNLPKRLVNTASKFGVSNAVYGNLDNVGQQEVEDNLNTAAALDEDRKMLADLAAAQRIDAEASKTRVTVCLDISEKVLATSSKVDSIRSAIKSSAKKSAVRSERRGRGRPLPPAPAQLDQITTNLSNSYSSPPPHPASETQVSSRPPFIKSNEYHRLSNQLSDLAKASAEIDSMTDPWDKLGLACHCCLELDGMKLKLERLVNPWERETLDQEHKVSLEYFNELVQSPINDPLGLTTYDSEECFRYMLAIQSSKKAIANPSTSQIETSVRLFRTKAAIDRLNNKAQIGNFGSDKQKMEDYYNNNKIAEIDISNMVIHECPAVGLSEQAKHCFTKFFEIKQNFLALQEKKQSNTIDQNSLQHEVTNCLDNGTDAIDCSNVPCYWEKECIEYHRKFLTAELKALAPVNGDK